MDKQTKVSDKIHKISYAEDEALKAKIEKWLGENGYTMGYGNEIVDFLIDECDIEFVSDS